MRAPFRSPRNTIQPNSSMANSTTNDPIAANSSPIGCPVERSPTPTAKMTVPIIQTRDLHDRGLRGFERWMQPIVDDTVGSYGRRAVEAQLDFQGGPLAGYIAADDTHEDGWRAFSSSSDLRRMYVDLGTRGDQGEFRANFTGADTFLGAVAATPVELLNRKWSTAYTWPQTTHLWKAPAPEQL
jgi:hypothetical protein